MSRLTTLFPLTTLRRQAIFYVLLFAGTGASLPFMPLWFKSNGMNAGQIGIILAIPLLLRAISGPLSGLWADSFRLYRTPLIVLALSGAAFYALMGLSSFLPPGLAVWRFPAFLVLFALGYSCMTSLSPLIDAMTLYLARRDSFAYAIPRAAGSTSFIVVNISLGMVLLIAPPGAIVVWVVAFVALTGVTARLLLGALARHETPPVYSGGGWGRIAEVMRGNKSFWWLLIATGCLQAAHSFYYAFSTIIWKAQGLSSSVCGYLWAIGVVAEVAFMSLGEPLRRRLGPWRMLMLAAVLAFVRWTTMMFSPPLWLLWPLQCLHAFSFAAGYLAGLDLVHRLSPKGSESLGQTLNSAYGTGVMMGLGTLASGVVYQTFGARGYGLMALVALIGLGSAIGLYLRRPIPTVPAEAAPGSSR